jgi:hypothetical protein
MIRRFPEPAKKLYFCASFALGHDFLSPRNSLKIHPGLKRLVKKSLLRQLRFKAYFSHAATLCNRTRALATAAVSSP